MKAYLSEEEIDQLAEARKVWLPCDGRGYGAGWHWQRIPRDLPKGTRDTIRKYGLATAPDSMDGTQWLNRKGWDLVVRCSEHRRAKEKERRTRR